MFVFGRKGARREQKVKIERTGVKSVDGQHG